MLFVVLAVMVSAPVDNIKSINPQNICFLNQKELKKFRSKGDNESNLEGVVVKVDDYDPFTEMTIQLKESNEFCGVYARILLPSVYAKEMSVSGQAVSFQGSFLKMTYSRCDKEVSNPKCELRFAYTN
jgi:hypothetical protein